VLGAHLQRALASDKVEVACVRTARRAIAAAGKRPPDVVLLDVGLPDGDGIDLCRALLAARPALLVIILTARDAENDIIAGLDSGAVDYVTTPFRLADLCARVRIQLRRAAANDDRLRIGDLIVDRTAHTASIAGTSIELRAKEFDLLANLAEGAGTVRRREDLIAQIWDRRWIGAAKTLDVTISTLRRKLDDAKPHAVAITTLRGVGYRLERA